MAPDPLASALAAERAIVDRSADEVRAIAGGRVIRDDRRPDIWHVNRVHLSGKAAMLSPTDLTAIADRWLGDRPHRRVTFDDVISADGLWAVLEQRGWSRERSAVMVLAPGADRRSPLTDVKRGIAVRPLTETELRTFQPRALAGDAGIVALGAGLPERIADAQVALRAGTPAVAFGAAPSDHPIDAPVSTTTLYLDPDVGGRRVAFIDQVATLRPFRERGLATAVVTAAIDHADRWGADVTALFADADDWPQVMYAGLGFTTVGHQVTVHRAA
jgi:GNAT superfamily N-acetyltransferase